MTWLQLKNEGLKRYYPGLVLEEFERSPGFHALRAIVRISLLVFFVVSAAFIVAPTVAPVSVANVCLGILLVIVAVWFILFFIVAFYRASYFSDMPDGLEHFSAPPLDFQLARLLYESPSSDPVKGFVQSRDGKLIMYRAGIFDQDIEHFLNYRHALDGSTFSFAAAASLGIDAYAGMLFDQDHNFADFLFSHEIQRADLIAIAELIMERELSRKKKERWWTRNSLGRIPGIGKDWSYGRTFTLDKYSRPLPEADLVGMETHALYGTKELQELEAILVRDREANCLLISNDESGRMEIVSRLGNLLESGKIFPELEHKRIILVDTDLLIAENQTKGKFEMELRLVMNEAVAAGNIILVFPDLPTFLLSSQSLSADTISLLDPFFGSTHLQTIALSSVDGFHEHIESNSVLMQKFEKIIVEEIDESNTVRVLENSIIPIEAKTGIFFTYPALVSVAESAERYFPASIMPDKALDLLDELAPKVAAAGKKIVVKQDVLSLVQVKTGIPVGEVQGEEREKLLNLEPILHQRIIGQDEAVNAIAAAVRRARSGINNPSRPLGSFLFLGPTGVGKTETTKALGDIFFGKENTMLRLDMSEYAGADALAKLIGEVSGKTGLLATMLREHPYGVLLLDEFEKTTPEVMNIFLQVLDEGFFSDTMGKKISARNLLIIATSNAGAELIWDAVKKGEDLASSRDLIIDEIIHAGIFKPELLNRFDGVIIFHPLAADHLEKIARLQLEKLQKRLATRGVKIAITDDLVQYVLKFGTDPKFGARPMSRAIQDKVEQVVADKLIRGTVPHGTEINLTAADLH